MKVRATTTRRLIQFLMLTISFVVLIAGRLWADEEHPSGPMGFFDVLMLPRVWVGALFCLMGAVLLIRAKATRSVRLAFLPIIFFFFGVLFVLPLGEFARGMGLHPSPMCTVTKPFLFLEVGRGIPIIFPAIFFSIAVFSIAGNKLFCGWVCPVGALQELAHEIPISKKAKVKLPFKVTNWIRVLLFVAFVPLVFLIGHSIYDYINPFEALHWGWDVLSMTILAIVLVAALFVFRPFCYVACPLGLLTWMLEHISIAKIKIDRDKCTLCYDCVEMSPCPAMKAIVDGKRSRPDCHACGRCLNTCNEDAIKFRV